MPKGKDRRLKQIGVTVEPATRKKLEEVAAAERRTISEIGRFAIEEYLDRHAEKTAA